MPTLATRYSGPYIDERVEHVGATKLRSLNAKNLRDLDKTWVIQDNDKALAVLVPYDQFLTMQKQLITVLEALELLRNQKASKEVLTGLEEAMNGKLTGLAEIRKSLLPEK